MPRIISAFAALCGIFILMIAPAAARDIRVEVGQAFPIRLDAPAMGVAIGNALIAEMSVQNDQYLFVTGISPGATNLVIVGAENAVLFSGRVVVVSAQGAAEAPAEDASCPVPTSAPSSLPRSFALSSLPDLAVELERQARALSGVTAMSSEFRFDLSRFADSAERLAVALRDAGIEQDLPCIFHGMSLDARELAVVFLAARSGEEFEAAFTDLRVLLDDAILIAAMAASSAAEESAAPSR